MKKNAKKAFLALTAAALLTGCSTGGNGGSSSEASSSAPKIVVDTLAEAIANTSSYKLSIAVEENVEYVYQIYDPNFYYYSPDNGGYAVIPSDSDYLHSFGLLERGESIYDFDLDVYGRFDVASDYKTVFTTNFMNILTTYADDFVKIDESTFVCTVSDMADDLWNYTQNRNLRYTNYFSVIVGDDGRISSFSAYEKDSYVFEEIYTVDITKFDRASFAPYSRWVESGSKVNTRIYDLKTGHATLSSYNLNYRNEEVEISGIVSAFDYDGAFYIANDDEKCGSCGIRVVLEDSSSSPSLNDIVTVKGVISAKNYVAYIDDASYSKSGVATYYPYFEEESISDYYGGGYYGAYAFANNPTYGGSVYSAYAYISSLPETLEEGKKTTIGLACPSYKATDGTPFSMQLILPAKMSLSEKESIVSSLKDFGIYSAEDNKAEEVSVEKVIFQFDPKVDFCVTLEYGSNSHVGKALTPAEKVEDKTGLKDFPFPSVSTFSCFRFGGSSGMFIESTYGRSEKEQQGVYYYASLTSEELSKEISDLETYGFSLYDIIKDDNSKSHSIYKMGDVYVDFRAVKSSFSSGYTVEIWVYKGKLIYKNTISEVLADKLSFFNSDDFIVPEGVYQADCTYYELPSVDGQKFEHGSYVPCVTIDVDEDIFQSLRKRYLSEKGYSLYRNSDNSVYTYRTRGSTHYVLYKNIEGSDEKVFLDMVMYPTSDYTFLNHGDFAYRIEIMFYKGKTPMSTVYEDNLDDYFTIFNERNDVTNGLPQFSLPEGTKVEMVYALPLDTMEQFEYTHYGYFMDLNAFVYPSSNSTLDATYDLIVDGLKAAGYTLYNTTEKGNEVYFLDQTDDYGAYIMLMKDTSRKFIRLLEGIGGLDF